MTNAMCDAPQASTLPNFPRVWALESRRLRDYGSKAYVVSTQPQFGSVRDDSAEARLARLEGGQCREKLPLAGLDDRAHRILAAAMALVAEST